MWSSFPGQRVGWNRCTLEIAARICDAVRGSVAVDQIRNLRIRAEKQTVVFTVRQALASGAAELSALENFKARRDSELLLLHILKVDRTFLLAHPDHPLTEEQLAHYYQLIA